MNLAHTKCLDIDMQNRRQTDQQKQQRMTRRYVQPCRADHVFRVNDGTGPCTVCPCRMTRIRLALIMHGVAGRAVDAGCHVSA